MGKQSALNVAVIVAHPDDEILWAGGLILAHPEWNWFIATLCRRSDPDRAPRFFRVLETLGAVGVMADIDDGPEQAPLAEGEVRQAVLSLLPNTCFDVIITHGPRGEYTRHRRHEETCRAVVALWKERASLTRALWLFAYEDGGRRYFPRAEEGAHWRETPPEEVWRKKYRIITEGYGFDPESWEAKTTPREEAFWRFDSPAAVEDWMDKGQVLR
jgi:LmbE family N-acetylglucosaminyl deacetylase